MPFFHRGDGSLWLKPTAFSGLDASGICSQVADLNNDGLLDIVFAADPGNSGPALTPDRYEDKVYWNTGLHGARRGLRAADRQASRHALGHQPRQSYTPGCPLEVHFGLGRHETVDVRVSLPDGETVAMAALPGDRDLGCNLQSGTATAVPPTPSSPTP
jgi:hypothetical protein